MSKYWSQRVKELEPYVPGEQPNDTRYIKLNTNENPYPPAPEVLSVFQSYNYESLSLYSDPNASELKQVIADTYQLESNQVFVGNGSDEVLAHTFVALLKHDKPLLMPEISYSFYPVYCRLFGIENKSIALDNNFEINVDDYFIHNGGIIIPNPNAPTGLALSLDKIEQLLTYCDSSVVVIDEAYVDFGAESAISLINRYDNLLVIHTLSKSRSLAGLRVGYAMGSKTLIEGLERVKNSFNSYPLGRVDIVAASAAINATSYLKVTSQKIQQTRKDTVKALMQMEFTVLPSKANFIFIKPPIAITAKQLYLDLKAQGILIRYFNDKKIADFVRVTIGTNESMNAFLDQTRLIIASAKQS